MADNDSLAQLAQHYASNAEGQTQKSTERSEMKVAQFAGVNLPDISSTVASAAAARAELCADWPQIKGFIELAENVLGWFSPTSAAKAKQFVASFEATALPTLCPKK
jgi:uncharacterized protein YpuA (DUF1002 family)